MSKTAKISLSRVGFVILIITLSLSCGRESKISSGQATPDVPKQAPLVTEASSESHGGADDNLMKDHAYLELTLLNSTGGMIDETAIVFGKHSSTFGIVGRGGSKGYLGWTQPVGTNVLVRWRDSGKVKRETLVDISGIYDRITPGNLTFTIDGTNVTVSFAKLDRK